ncbi:MAG: hypothetical protein COT73_00605 [Bdellovibrio sp. CG10_big_fil_rev_8_21_14_0_10_47_8]|nr:MAG: hypothetical protein COT73_00605 [Bdellovibrio sp. CG10_big_fil_rev_8_21_14_0_10_47_8]
MIEVRNLGKRFPKSNQAVFSEVQFSVPAGDFVSILGPSGCGKSTLLRILAGLEAPTHGQVLGVDQVQSGLVFQEARLIPWQTCLENVLLPVRLRQRGGLNEASARARDLLTLLGLQEKEMHFPAELSGGMKMRTALARGLITSPSLLLLDEPFSALDEPTRWKLQEELRALYETQKWTALFVTHSLEEACFLSQRIFIFDAKIRNFFEFRPDLPAHRKASLRQELSFFQEVQRLRKIFFERSFQ